MAHRSSWPAIYPGLSNLPDDAVTHGHPRLLVTDTSRLIGVAGSTAIITHICQHAIHAAAEYCRINNITFVDNERLFEFLRQRSAAQLVIAQAAARDDAGRNSTGGNEPAQSAGQRTETGRSVKGKRRT